MSEAPHNRDMPWFLPGVAPTNRRLEFPLVVIVGFRDGKIRHEHLSTEMSRPHFRFGGR